ncbi:hypothetical protein K437DRAFT_137099 [Tilletiaria anomala UBC 951]|uniref:Uncharacterized protein n=1 Tax=Tilletiaria anomala (strain ATCC 24038 / CBS 436.72 / UBC 951) TaxID=1037660 RepID=A0A066VW34_TILAU|nr:uncharacterized protein K437DRAFT_137099 [Tilletiaria anomala UBC 951]KDN44493.1 hypothetical protein K437DRAFT_137099 [Tilletiaria anomala UBC 951]
MGKQAVSLGCLVFQFAWIFEITTMLSTYGFSHPSDTSYHSSIPTFVSSFRRTPSSRSTTALVPPENAARINASPGRRARTSIRYVKNANGPLGILSSLGQDSVTML